MLIIIITIIIIRFRRGSFCFTVTLKPLKCRASGASSAALRGCRRARTSPTGSGRLRYARLAEDGHDYDESPNNYARPP